MIDQQSSGKQAIRVTYILFIISLLSTLLIPAAPPVTYAEPVINVNPQNGNQQNQETGQQQQPNQNQGTAQQQPNQTNQSNNQQPKKDEVSQLDKAIKGLQDTVTKMKNGFTQQVQDLNPFSGKKTDYEGCDLFEIVCTITMWTLNLVKNGFEAVNSFYNSFLFHPKALIDKNKYIKDYFAHMRDLSWSFLALFILFQGIRLLAMAQITENREQVKSTIQKLFITACLIVAIDPAYEYLSRLNQYIMKAIFINSGENLLQNFVGSGFTIAATGGIAMINSAPVTPLLAIALLIVVACILLVTVQIIIRNAELALLYILGPLAVVSYMNEKYNYFHVWWQEVLRVMFSTSIQLLLMMITLDLFIRVFNPLTFLQGDVFFCLGFLYLTIKVPNMLRDWLSTNSGSFNPTQKAMGPVMTVTSVARRVITKI